MMPHILRSVALIGMDSVAAPLEQRLAAWRRLERDLDREKLRKMTTVQPMSRLPQLAEDIIAGRIRGRVVIDLAAT